MTPLVTQVLLKKKKQRPLAKITINKESDHSDEKNLYNKDVAGFVIFLVVVFSGLMISLYA
jgi:hypothetical protein